MRERFIKRNLFCDNHETQFTTLEKERTNALEVAAQENQEAEAQKEDAGSVSWLIISVFLLQFFFITPNTIITFHDPF